MATPTLCRFSGSLHRSMFIDFSKECAADPDFLLTIGHVKAWETKHGVIGKGEWVVLRSDWDSRAHDEGLFLNANETGPHTPGPTSEVIEYLIGKGIVGWGSQCIGTNSRSGRWHEPAIPGAQPPAQEQLLRPRLACKPQQAASQGRYPDRRAIEDRTRHRLTNPRSGSRAESLIGWSGTIMSLSARGSIRLSWR